MSRNVTYTLNLNSNVSSILQQTEKSASNLDNSMWQLQKTMAAFGIGLGFHYLTDTIKDWTQGAADFETAMLRIRNASEKGFGIFNDDFLLQQVDKFRLKLQETSDAYGKFLFFVKNTPYSNSQKNTLFEDLNIVGKVGGISQENMDATMNNISKLLTEGILEGRTLRNLSRVHPGVVPFLAEEMGLKTGQKDIFSKVMEETDEETFVQKLSQLISSGKLTKLHLSPDALFKAFERYAESSKSGLPETLHTLQSEINDLDNTWLKFKNSLVLDQKPELKALFEDLKDGIHFLVDHEETIIKIGKEVFNIAEAYAIWRLSLLAMQSPFAIMNIFKSEQERLISVLNLYNKTTQDSVVANSNLSESENLLSQSVIEETTVQEFKIEKIVEEQIALNTLKQSLMQVSVQTDLFTESQLQNTSTIELMKEEIIQLDMFSADAFRNFGIGVNGMQASLNKFRTTVEDTSINLSELTKQGTLFTDSELEMSAAMKSTGDLAAIYNEELRLQNELLLEKKSIQESLLLQQQAALDKEGLEYDAMLAAQAGYSGAKSSGIFGTGLGISDLAVPVMITWIANDVLNAMFPRDKNEWNDDLRTHLFGLNLSSADYNDEYEMRIKNGWVDANHPNFNGIAYSNPYWMSPEDYKSSLNIAPSKDFNQMLSILGISSYHPTFYDQFNNPSLSDNKKDSKLSFKDTSHIKGNSSNYFTVNIHEMNGIKGYSAKYEKSGTEIEEKKIAEIAGVELVRILTGVANDIQYKRGG